MPARCDAMKIRARMNEHLMTAAQLADAAGLSASTMNRILNEKDYRTSDATLNMLAKALDCSPFDLLREEAIGAMIQQETEQAVTGVVAEAVAEALTVVVDEMAPSDDSPSPQEIAQAVPPMEVKTPPVLDVAAYIDHIKAACEKEVRAVLDRLEDMRKNRNFWRLFCVLLLVAIVGLVWYFVWEILNPDKGITAILWNIYNSKNIPAITPKP